MAHPGGERPAPLDTGHGHRGSGGGLTVQITAGGGADIVTVWLDGEQIMQQSVAGVPSTALLAFTGGTGTRTDVHLVRDVAISATR